MNLNKKSDVFKKLAKMKGNADGGERLPSIPLGRTFKGTIKDKRDNPKHKKGLSKIKRTNELTN